VLPNTYFDPKKGHELYNRYLDELELAAELGFDGISVNEHHQNAYGLMPSPVVMAAALARRTKHAKIAILGNAFCLREHPLTLAEEHAMLDCITGGRLITGMVRGIGAEYYSMGANPAFSHARFQEAHDLVVQSWTAPVRSLSGQVLSLRIRECVAAALPAAASADLGALHRVHRDDRMGRASIAQIRLSADLQPG
jgi:Coenzyme F420-dependent N5,N10-methylene tetrahydromethanopterin reductase and related flavin-dependent oxidoreductases